jgi:tetratricopeptide (TPR) repeat protein
LHPQHGRAKAALERIDVLRANPEQAKAWLADRANAPSQADPHTLGVEAYAAFTAGQHLRAAELYEKLISLSAGEATSEQLKNLAVALDRAEPGPRSVEAIERALEKSGDDASLSLLLGKRLMAMGRSQEAMKHLEVAVASEALQWTARFDLGLARLASGDPSGAITEFGALVAERPDDRGAIQNLAKAQVEGGMNEAALTTLERLERLAPREAEHWLTRAAILQRMERHGAAEELLKRACTGGVEEACR